MQLTNLFIIHDHINFSEVITFDFPIFLLQRRPSLPRAESIIVSVGAGAPGRANRIDCATVHVTSGAVVADNNLVGERAIQDLNYKLTRQTAN
jgi:hypothetical protein